MHPFGVAGGRRRPAERTGQVVQGGVTERGDRVEPVGELVGQCPGRSTGERPGDHGRTGPLDDGPAVHGGGARFLGQQEGGSDHGRGGTGAQAFGGRCGVSVAECPPAADPWTISRSTPAPAATPASSALVTVWATALPAERNARMTSAVGTPKVKLTRGTGSASSRSSLPDQPSSSCTGRFGSVTPNRSAAGRSSVAYRAYASGSTGTGFGANRLTPNVSVTARTSPICRASCSGVL